MSTLLPLRFEQRKRYYLAYTGLFLLFCLGAFGYLFASGHSLILSDDGLDEHLTYLTYCGQWIRDWISTGTPTMWNFSMGYGADAILTMQGWLDEPFTILYALVPEEGAQYLYQVLAIVRLYLAGIAFSAFCRYHKREGFSTLLGALVYTFSGFCLAWGALRHPMFVDAAIFLPWVLLAADKILDGKSPLMFIVAMAVTFFTDWYWGYMIGIMLLLFCLMRYFLGQRERSVADFFKLVGRFVLYLVVALALAAVAVLPTVMYTLQMGRLEAGVDVSAFDQLGTYALYPLTLTGGDSSSLGMGLECVAAFFIVMLFAVPQFRKAADLRQAKIAFIVLTIFACFPIFGSIFNGFSYSTDRWMFVYAFAAAYIVVLLEPRVPQLKRFDVRRILVVVIVLEAWMAVLLLVWDKRIWAVCAMVLLALTFVMVRFLSDAGHTRPRRILLVVLLFLGVTLFSNGHLLSASSDNSKPYIDNLVKFGQAYSTQTTDSASSLVVGLDDDAPLYRYDKPSELTRRNSSLLQGLYSVDFYSSFYNQRVDDYRTELAIPSASSLQNFLIATSDSRASVEAVSGVKYFLVRSGKESSLPYDFDTLVAQGSYGGGDYEVYRTDNVLPLAYTYDKSISTEEYQALSPLQRQEATLQACEVDGTDQPEADLDLTGEQIDYAVDQEKSSDATLEDGKVVCTADNAKLTLNFTGKAGCETYVYMDNLDLQDYSPSQLVSSDEYEAMGLYDRFNLFVKDNRKGTTKMYNLTFEGGAISSKKITCDTSACNFYGGKHDWLVNLGYSDSSVDSITITFGKAGEYTFDDFQVLVQPMDGLSSQVDSLGQVVPDELDFGCNSIVGSIHTDDSRLLYISVPYSEGWSATVDGEPAEIKCANTAFMAIELDPGDHTFELHYQTPWLVQGALISMLGLIALLVGGLLRRRRIGAASVK